MLAGFALVVNAVAVGGRVLLELKTSLVSRILACPTIIFNGLDPSHSQRTRHEDYR